MPTIASVYLYRLEEVEGAEYIEGGQAGIEFHASTEPQLESSGGPAYQPTGPYIRCDVPIKADAPDGAQIQVRYRLAMGYDMEWVSAENTYNWYVQDFILNFTVGGSNEPDVPIDGADAIHHLYMPAGTTTTMNFVRKSTEDVNHSGNWDVYYNIASVSWPEESDAVSAVAVVDKANSHPNNVFSNFNFQYNQGTVYGAVGIDITSTEGAEVGSTCVIDFDVDVVYYEDFWAAYYGSLSHEQYKDRVIVHIIEPRSETLAVGETKTISPLEYTGEHSQSELTPLYCGKNENTYAASAPAVTANDPAGAVTVNSWRPGARSLGNRYYNWDAVTWDNLSYKIKGEKTGRATTEFRYAYDYQNPQTGLEEYTIYVDVVNVTVTEKGDDPSTIDGLDIKKEVDKDKVVGGETLTYTITVKNDSSVDKTVTVTDELQYGINCDTVKFETTAGGNPTLGGDYGSTVIWTPTVPAKGTAVLKITCEVEDNGKGGNLNNKATLESENGDTTDSLTVTTQVTPKRTKTVTIVKEFIGKNGNNLTAAQVPTDFRLDYSYTYGDKTTTGSLTVDAATAGTNGNDHPTLTWTLDVPVDQDTSSTSKTPLTVTEVNYNKVAGYTWEKQSGLNSSDEKAVTGTYQINAAAQLPTNYIRNYYSKNPDPTPILSIDKKLTTTPVKVGQNVTYIITVTNSGTADASSVTVSDPLNTEYLRFVSYQINNDEVQTTEPAKSLYLIGTVAKGGGTATLKITAEVLKTDAEGKLPANTAYLNPTDPDNPGGNGGNGGTSTVDPTPADKLALTGITKALVTEENKKTLNVPETILSTEGITIPKTAQISLRGDNSSSAKLLYKITVTGDVGAKYKVTELGNGKQISGNTLPEGIALVSGALSGTIPGAGAVDIYVTMEVKADDIDGNGNVKNVAKLASGETSTTGAPGEGEGKDTGTSNTPGVKVYTVTVVRYIPDPTTPGEFIKIEDEQTYVELPDGTKYVLQSQQGNGRARSKGVLLSTAEEPPVSIPFVKTFEYEGQWYSYDDPVTRAKNEGQGVEEGTVDGANVTVKLYYDLDMKGTIGTDDEGDPTDTTDGTPDKYQAKVIYTAIAGGTQTGVTTYATITDENGNMATEGTISIAGATASANEGNHFTKWTAEATGHDGWTYEESTNATLAADDNVAAKGGAEYTFTANFEANSGAPLSVSADDVTTTYDGRPHPVTPTANKAGAAFTVVYKDAAGNVITGAPVDAGEYTAEITATLDGKNATYTAKVTINKRQLNVTTGSGSKVYDGTPLTNATATVTVSGGEVSGEHITATATGSQTEVGESKNTYTMDWGSAKEGNYQVTEFLGTLRVTAQSTIIPPTDPYYPPYNPGTPGTTIPDATTPLDPGTDIDDQDVPLAGTVGLNNTDHFAYVIGYDEDHVRPLANITRAEAATIFFRLMEDDFRQANWATTNSFTDVKEGDWYNNAVSTCARAGILKGREDGRFDPNATITRAEFAVMAARFLDGSQTDDGTGNFSDTASHWAAKEIRLAAKAGWITGSGNKFEPDAYITRAQVMLIVNRMLDRTPDADHMLPEMKKWSDNPEGTWYYEAVQEATNEHDYTRDETNVETWTALKEGTDWAALELGWAANNGASASGTETETQGLPDGI